MVSRWWYGVALGAATEGVAFAWPTDGTLSDAAGLAFLLGYLLVPAATYLDLRALRGSVPWTPSARRWLLVALVPVGNVAVGIAYCLRRRAAVRGTVPGRRWRYAALAGAGVWTAAFALEIALDYATLPSVDRYLFGPLVGLGLLGVPVAVYLDAEHVRGCTDWAARDPAWAVGAAVPYLGAVVCAAYLVRRRRAFADAEDPSTVRLPERDDGGSPSSPWFRRAAGLFAVHFLLVLWLAVTTSADGTTVEFAGLLLWFPFGPFFAGCVYMDARWRRDHDREVGDSWYLYLASALVQAAAFWYLLRRATKGIDAAVDATPGTGTEND